MKCVELVLVLVGTCPLSAQSGGIADNGHVTDAVSAAPISAALVTLVQDGSLFTAWTKSGASGEFTFSGVAPGSYSLCLQTLEDTYIDPCWWDGQRPTLSIVDGHDATIELQAMQAFVLNVEVQDPQNLVGRDLQAWQQAHVRIGIWGPNGHYHAAHKTGIPGRYRIGIPRFTALKLQIAPINLRLADAEGVALPASGFERDINIKNASVKESTALSENS